MKSKKLDREIEAEFYHQGHGIQFDIMDLGKISQFCRDQVAGGGSLPAAMAAAIAKYRLPVGV